MARTKAAGFDKQRAAIRDSAAREFADKGYASRELEVFLNEHHGPEDIFALYRDCAGCAVSSLHDGMNLVAKEFVASRDGDGALILSRFAGAANELGDALLVNPYDVDDVASIVVNAILGYTDYVNRTVWRK